MICRKQMHHNFENQSYACLFSFRRTHHRHDDITKQPTVALKAANIFWIGLDESIDINSNLGLAAVARYCSNSEVHEELCRLKPMYGTTKEKDILDIFIKNLEEREIDITKMFLVATDGAPAMMGQRLRFVTIIEQKTGHLFMKSHCIIHQENLCAKISNSALNDVMSTVPKIASVLVASSATTHRQF